MLTADKTKDAADISLVEFAYNDIGRITDFDQTHFGGTERTIDYEYDQAGLLESTVYPDGSTTTDRDGYVYFCDYENRLVKIEGSLSA